MNREMHCPHCGRINDTHDGIHTPDPSPGHIGICWQCRGLAILTPFGFLRPLKDWELEEAMADPGVRRALGAIAESFTPSQAMRLLGDDH